MLKSSLMLTLFLTCMNPVWAQSEGPGRPEYQAQSRLLTLRVVPRDKQAKLFFAGRKVAEIDFEKDHRVLEITALQKNEAETLQFSKEGEAYVIRSLPNWTGPYDLIVKAETKGHVEKMKVRIKNPKP